jgi:crotonobetainyl-CoA:carnitine CoA-transferase CaiB-like acyl-CoA transferase
MFLQDDSGTGPKSILAGVKVLEMCRVIAGPSIARILTEYGADVLKITSPYLSDVPWFQVEGSIIRIHFIWHY